jgi:hypothetical protein
MLTGAEVGATFADGTAWNGYFYEDDVTLAGGLTVKAPIAVVTTQVCCFVQDWDGSHRFQVGII